MLGGGGGIAYLMQDAEKMGNCSKEVMVAFFSETFSGFFMFVCLFVVLVFFFFSFFFFSGEIIFSTVKIKRTLRTNEGFSYEVFCCVTLQRSLISSSCECRKLLYSRCQGPFELFFYLL